MDIDDSQSIAFCSYCGTKHLIKKEINVTNNYYGSPSDGAVPSLITEGTIERAKNYQAYISSGVVLLVIGVVFTIVGFSTIAGPDPSFPAALFLGFIMSTIGLFLIVAGVYYRRVLEMSESGTLNVPRTPSFCTGCGNRIDVSSKYCKFCGTPRR